MVSVGGGLREYRVGGRQLLDGYGAGEMCSAARGQPLIPWPNRLRDGRYEFHGEQHQVPLSEPDRHNAIHGLVRWSNWSVRQLQSHRVTVGHTLHPQPGYPFLLDISITYELSESGLRVEFLIGNEGEDVAPVGAGQHPYLLPPGGSLDESVLQLPAETWLETDERQIPTGEASVADTEYDFRAGRKIGSIHLDTAFADLQRDADGIFSLRLTDGERSIRVWLDGQFKYVMAFTGDTLPDPHARRRSLGVEPMSCPPNALQTGKDVVPLEPGQCWRGSWGIQPE